MTKDEILRLKIERSGKEKQMRQAQEEFAEGVIAISHYLRGREGSEVEIVEETEDIKIMLEQLEIMFPYPKERQTVREHKLSRLAAKLGVEYTPDADWRDDYNDENSDIKAVR